MVSKVNFMHIVKTSIFTSVFACFWRSGLARGAPNGRLCSALGSMWGPFGDFCVQKMLHLILEPQSDEKERSREVEGEEVCGRGEAQRRGGRLRLRAMQGFVPSV